MVPGVCNSLCVIRSSGAPNLASARQMRRTFSVVGLIQISMSFVARTTPCAATAAAPITRYSAFSSDNARNISAKWRFIECACEEYPGVLGDLPLKIETLGRSHAQHGFIDLRLFADRVLLN